MCPIVDGTPVDAATTNAQLLDAVSDDYAQGKIGFHNTDPVSGKWISNTQRYQNNVADVIGLDTSGNYTGEADATGKTYSAPAGTISDGDSHKLALTKLADKFDPTTGHAHTGAAGDGAPIAAVNIVSVPLAGYFLQGTTLIGVTGGSEDVSTELTGKTPSTGPTFVGVVVTGAYNKVVLRDTNGTAFEDGSGNTVYGRLTESSLVWTLTFYSEPGGTETPYSFGASTDIVWYYQELYNPLDNPPVYSELAVIPSDNVTADVVDATTSLKGKVQLATSAQSVGSSNSSGTANATVANADHVHQGLHAVQEFTEAVNVYGDIILKGSGGTTITRTSQTFEISSVKEPSVELRTLTGGEATAKSLTLVGTPATPAKTLLIVKSAGGQFYGDDFTVTGTTLSWSGLGLDGVLASGDKLTIVYWT